MEARRGQDSAMSRGLVCDSRPRGPCPSTNYETVDVQRINRLLCPPTDAAVFFLHAGVIGDVIRRPAIEVAGGDRS